MRWERGAVCLGPVRYLPHSCSGDPASAWSRAPGSARKLAIPLSCLVLLAPPAQGQQHLTPDVRCLLSASVGQTVVGPGDKDH